MKRINKILAWMILSLMSLSLVMGYAAVVENLGISGSSTYKEQPFEGVYITNVEFVSSSGASDISFSYLKPTNFNSIVRATSKNGSITYKITVHNNTAVTHWYIKPDWTVDYESNGLINASGGVSITTKDKLNDSGATFNSDDWIPPGTTRDFYVTYEFGANAQGYITTLVNFKFGIKMDAVHDEFLAMLNDKISLAGYHYIADVFNDKYSEDKTTVIGNIGEDQAVFDALFGSNLTVNIDGTEKPVTVMVQRENVDNKSTGDSYSGTSGAPTGCEYTVYLTVDNLGTAGGVATVYAISYTCGADGQWYQLAQLYKGTAKIVDYDTTDSTYQGAFDITTWIASPETYEVANGIVYKVGQSQGDQYDKLKTIKQLMSTNDTDIFNDVDNSKIFKKVYDILQANKNSSDPAIYNLRIAFERAAPYYTNMNNGQEFKVVRSCTRSEIIPYLIALQDALDYYNQIEHNA